MNSFPHRILCKCYQFITDYGLWDYDIFQHWKCIMLYGCSRSI